MTSTRLPNSGAPWRNVRERGQPRDRQRRRLREADVVRQRGHAVAGHRNALCPAEFIGQCDDARAGRRAAAVCRLLQHDARNVLAWDPAFPVVAHRAQFAAVERKRMHRNESLGAVGQWFRKSRNSRGALPSVW